jgi:hypothetical protein
MIAAVGQKMNLRRRRRGIGENAHDGFAASGLRPRFLQFQIFGEHARGGLGHTLLQQQIRRLEQRTGHEAALHGVVPQQIDQASKLIP